MKLLQRRAGLLALMVAAAVLPALQPSPATADPPAPLEFSLTGFEGAGFQNVLAERGDVMLLGGDVSGMHRSTNRGNDWSPQNGGIEAEMPRFLGLADVAFSDTVADEVYACGLKGFYVSTDAGLTWALRSRDVPVCSGGNNMSIPALPETHPRSTGDLIVQAGGFLYVGSFSGGVFRSADGGATWTPIALAPAGTKQYYVRGLVGDPTDPDALYAATYGDRVWKITGASTETPVATQLANSPVRTEELAAVGSAVYAVAGSQGVFMTSDGGATWPARNNGVDINRLAQWQAITGYVAPGGNTVLYIGAYDPVTVDNMANSVMRSTNGGSSWTSITKNAHAGETIGGPGGPAWWFTAAKPQYKINKRGFVAAQIVVDADDTNTIYVAGRGGTWRTSDGGNNWYPIVRGLGATINRGVAVDPNNPNRVIASNTDWMQVRSTNGMRTITMDQPPTGSAVFDTSLYGGRSYIAAGERDLNTEGNIWSKPLDGSGSWTDENLDAAAANKRPLAVVAGRDAADQRVILAAVHESGVYRKSAGTWTLVSGPSGPFLGPQTTKRAYFSWVDGSADVFLYDRPSGLWRSRDYGVTWSLIWALPSNAEHTGYVAGDPLDPDVAYVSSSSGLYRLTGLTAGTTVEDTTITATQITTVPNPGPLVAVAPAGTTRVYVAGLVGLNPHTPAGLYQSDNGVDFTDVSDELYRRVALIPHQIAVGSDGRVWAALDGNGVIVGRVPPPPDFDPPDTTLLTAPTGTVTTAAAQFTFESTEPFSSFACTLDGVTNACTSPANYTVGNGTHTFAVAATDEAGNADLSPATAEWTVELPPNPPPGNDDFAGAATITGNVASVTRDTVGATKQSDEPNHAGNAGGHSAWFTHKATKTGPLTVSTTGSDFATLLAVYTGGTLGALTPVASTTSGRLTFNATLGVTYRIAVDGVDGAAGNAVFSLPVLVSNTAYTPNPGTTAPLGATVQWEFTGTSNQRATSQTGLFDSGLLGPGSRFTYTFNAAGTFWYQSVQAAMKARIAVPMTAMPKTGTRATTFTLTWARAATPGLTYDVQMKKPGSSTWTLWRSNVAALSDVWTPGGAAVKGTYSFQARVRSAGTPSGWSATQTVKVQ